MATIIVVVGESRGVYLQLEPQVITVGRDEACDLQVLDQSVSRRHVEIRPAETGSGFFITDLNSSNGVFVGGRRTDEAKLRDGDLIEIGATKLLFTDRDFPDRRSAEEYSRKEGEKVKATIVGRRNVEEDSWSNA